jgi:hypothetical protein
MSVCIQTLLSLPLSNPALHVEDALCTREASRDLLQRTNGGQPAQRKQGCTVRTSSTTGYTTSIDTAKVVLVIQPPASWMGSVVLNLRWSLKGTVEFMDSRRDSA